MSIAIVAPTPVPFARGGAERAWSGLQRALQDYTEHDVELLKVPVREDTLPGLIAGYRAFAALDLSYFDLVVTSKYPAWIVSHANHVVWMFHPLRGLYDTYHRFGLPPASEPPEPVLRDLLAFLARRPPRRSALQECFARWDRVLAEVGPGHEALALPSPLARTLVHWLDALSLSPFEIVRHLSLSRTVAARPGYFPPGVSPTVAYPPPDLPSADGNPDRERAASVAPRPFFTVSRLDHPKRLDLLIRAMAVVTEPNRLLIGGTGPADADLRALAAGDDRIRFLGRVPECDLARLYTDALAVPFLPADEDLGLIALEAMSCAAPVVTCADSGGPTEFVVDGVTGLVVEPTVDALARALSRLAADPDRAARMGIEARQQVDRIQWPVTVAAILGRPRPGPGHRPRSEAVAPGPLDAIPIHPVASDPLTVSAGRRHRVVVTTTFPVGHPRHGGQLRCFHLYGALARHVDVDIVSLVDREADAGVRPLSPGLHEIGVARSEAHRLAGEHISSDAGMPVTDIVAGSHIAETPAYLACLRESLRGAVAVILAEPYLVPAVEAVGADVPRIYDAFNVESDLKAGALPGSAIGRLLLQQVQDLERRAVLDSRAITTCSAEDASILALTHGRALSDFTVVPNGTDCRYEGPTPAARRADRERWLRRWAGMRPDHAPVHHLAVFFASWHPPNLDAAEILLWLAPQMPDVQFVLGGSHGAAFADRTPPPNLVFIGIVSDRAKRALLAAADVALNPMLLGSGTNLKVIEYLAAGVPVVSTRFGVRGLAAVHGTHLLVAEPHEMEAAIRAVLADPEGAARRAEAGRALARDQYDWTTLGDRMANVVRRTARLRAGRPVVLAPGGSIRG